MAKDKKLKVNFAGVETRTLVPEGEYHAKVKEIKVEDGSAAQYLAWKFGLVDDDRKINGQSVYYNTSLAPQALWNLRNLLETLGVETPDGAMNLDLEAYVDLELMVRIEHEVYEGKNRAKVTDFTKIEETASSEDDAEKPEEAEEEEAEEAEEEEAEEADETEEEDDKISTEDVTAMSEDELKDLIKKHKLKVDIKGLEKKPKKRASLVCEALKKADLLADE